MRSYLSVKLKERRFVVLLLFAAIIFVADKPLYSGTFASLSPLTITSSPADGLISSPEPDWPQWRGPRRDGISDEKGLLESWPEGGPELLWKLDGLGTGWSCPIIVGHRIYITGDVGDDLVIFALNRSGKI